jgi:hypothetical protein
MSTFTVARLNINGGPVLTSTLPPSKSEQSTKMVLVRIPKYVVLQDCSQLDQAFGSCRENSTINSRVEQGEGIVRRAWREGGRSGQIDIGQHKED